MAAATLVTPAILRYIDHGEYPESEDVSSAELSSEVLQSLSQELRKEQEQVKEDIRAISKGTSSDIDTWISRAKALQADILKSREVARQIVAEAEESKGSKATAEDRRKKVDLLEKEVEFQEGVAARLEHIKHAKALLGEVQEYVVQGEVVKGLNKLEEAEESVNGMGLASQNGYGVAHLLGQRIDKLRERLIEGVADGWNARLLVETDEGAVQTRDHLEGLVSAAKALGTFDHLLNKYAHEFDRAVVKPRMSISRDGKVPVLKVGGDQISCKDTSEDTSISTLFGDLTTITDFLHGLLPTTVEVPLSQILIPSITSRLEEDWLEPAVPLELSDMPHFQDILKDVVAFAEKIETLGWDGSKRLRDWVQSAPRIWLTKRRETLLGDVRDLVFMGLGERKTVERVETQVVGKDDGFTQEAEGGDDDWDTAWDEPEPVAPAAPTQMEEDLDDASAWDMPDEDEPAKEGDNNDDEAWGWGDGNDNTEQPEAPKTIPQPAATVKGPQKPQPPQEREITLRETFTITAIPDGIFDLVRNVIFDAEALAGSEYSSTPIAPAAIGLYSLPTLALAIYRATAFTAYAKLESGNMFIYNDANDLSDKLRAWQASQPPASRLRLDNDVKALDQFAKSAYSADMESQRTILRDLLDGAQGFSNSTTIPFKMECESAVEQTVDRLRDVSKQWQPVLSQSALLQSIGSLLATVIGKMITEFEDLPDIGEAESKQLKSLCDRVSNIRDLFQQQAPEGGDARDMTFIYCPNWLKFQYLAEIMESSLADIKYLWKEGELSLEFEAEEVVGLMEALFAESSLRRQAISEIRRGGRQ